MTTRKGLSLSAYVKRRNGVPLGAPGSMRNMLQRSLGASSFSMFWRYWNPLWGYYLSRYIMRPSSRVCPVWLSVLITFLVSGVIHDIAVSLVYREITIFITPWFLLMGTVVVMTQKFQIVYPQFPWLVRAIINCAIIVGCLLISKSVLS